jgi:hypothetical protein
LCGAGGREKKQKNERICLSPLTARVEGTSGWPTLYGKTDRRTDHPLQNRSPPNHFRTTERLCARLWPKWGRWYYVEGERQLSSQLLEAPPHFFPARQVTSP